MEKCGKMKENRKNLHGFGEKFVSLKPIIENEMKRHDYNQSMQAQNAEK